jgi:isopenicillin-N N-acyltransferase like protein
MTPTRYPELTVSGSPRELGLQIGEALREQLRGFCHIALDRVHKTTRISRDAALRVAAAVLPLAEEYSPDSIAELRGTADASGVSFMDLMLLQIRNQLRDEPDHACTSLSFGPPFTPRRLVAQNWDNDPALDPFTVVLTRKPAGKSAFTSLTQAGLIGYIGGNASGVGVCLNSLPAPSRSAPAGMFDPPLAGAWGVPHYFIVREVNEATSLEDAVAAVRRAARAIPANMMLSTPEGPANLEITPDSVCVQTSPETGIVLHTNHCLAPELIPINEQFPELINSHGRLSRVQSLLQSQPGPLSTPDAISLVQSILRDHDNHPASVCRHANDDPHHGFWQTVFSVIISPETGEMLVSRGTPCNHAYERYPLA